MNPTRNQETRLSEFLHSYCPRTCVHAAVCRPDKIRAHAYGRRIREQVLRAATKIFYTLQQGQDYISGKNEPDMLIDDLKFTDIALDRPH